MDLSSIAKEALNVQSADFAKTFDEATSLLNSEKGEMGNLSIADHLVSLAPHGEALVIGDLHGDFESLRLILQETRFTQKMENAKDATMIFLGDYGDRGNKPVEVYYTILKLKLSFPTQVVLLRGNHEGPENLIASPHDLPFRFQNRFSEDWMPIYKKTRTLWRGLYNAVFVDECFLMVHGGISPKISSLQDIAQVSEAGNESLLEDLLWNDPVEGLRGISLSPRGAGKLFGKDVTEAVLGRLDVKVLIRGHEPSETGFKINHRGRVLTLFSRKGEPYYNRCGAYLQLQLEEKYENAQQLVPFIHKF